MVGKEPPPGAHAFVVVGENPIEEVGGWVGGLVVELFSSF